MPVANTASAVSARSVIVNWGVKVNGSIISKELSDKLVRGEIDTSLRVPAMCTLWFLDPDHSVAKDFAFGAPVIVDIKDAEPPPGAAPPETPFDGIVVGIEAIREAHNSYTVIRAYDRLHKLFHGRRTVAYLKVKYSDIARKITGENGLSPGTIEDAQGAAVHDAVFQHNESDGDFLERLAAEYGFVLRVRGSKVDFCKPPDTSSGPQVGGFGGSTPDQLVLGDDLESYHVSLNADLLVDKVQVRGWDPKTKKEVLGEAPSLAAKVAAPSTDAKKANQPFAGKVFTTSGLPRVTAGEVKHVATAIADSISASYAVLTATSIGNPRLRGGAVVSVGPTNTPYAGKYVVTSARHTLEEGSFMTEVTCAGLTDRGFAGALSNGSSSGRPAATAHAAPVPAVLPAIVTTNKDPEKLGRVKVKLPQLADPLETDWMRVATVGGGKDRGFVAIPEVNDEVLVAFENGDMRRGYVLGGLYNGVDKPAQRSFATSLAGNGDVDKRVFTSRAKHHLVFCDKSGEEHVQIQTGDEKLDVKVDQKSGAIVLDAGPGKSKVTINKDGTMTVECQGKISVESKTADIELKAVNVKIEAKQAVTVKGAQATLEGQASATVKASGQTKVEGAQVSVSGQAMAELKAAMVKIN